MSENANPSPPATVQDVFREWEDAELKVVRLRGKVKDASDPDHRAACLARDDAAARMDASVKEYCAFGRAIVATGGDGLRYSLGWDRARLRTRICQATDARHLPAAPVPSPVVPAPIPTPTEQVIA